jgi:exo-beta-1,3-glucanase (GH17 family)
MDGEFMGIPQALTPIVDDSYEGSLVGVANEINQRRFFEQYNAWIEKNSIISFYFSAFDEQWKGGFDGERAMEKAEKHWGVYKSDRSPKLLLQ